MDGLYYYKLISPYKEDVTKNCKLTVNEIDHNFFTLKEADIKDAKFTRFCEIDEECDKQGGILTIVKNKLNEDGEKSTERGDEMGLNLTIKYKDDAGENSMTVKNIVTAENLYDIIGTDILTKVITDSTLNGLGTLRSPIGLSSVEKTGMPSPALKVLDLTNGGRLPISAKGTRFVTKENVNDFGYLYDERGVTKISGLLDFEFKIKEIYKEVRYRKYYWRVPSKEDWDKLLNSIEPCNHRNHDSAACHTELGKFAGKFLKSQCGWVNSLYECVCQDNKPRTACTSAPIDEYSDEEFDEVTEGESGVPVENRVNPIGIDKYGMRILPAGSASFSNGTPSAAGFKQSAIFWTTSHIYDDPTQDFYTKDFEFDKSGVNQTSECPNAYLSVRLVKDYDGSNYKETEYIGGVAYRAILMPESKQVWLASNFANTEGFIGSGSTRIKPEYLKVNNGELPFEKRVELFINEFNGRYWEKKVLKQGDTIVINNPSFDTEDEIVKEICWDEELPDGTTEEHCVEITIPKTAQKNVEYRVYTDDDKCNKTLVNTDDLVVERILNFVVPILETERIERIRTDEILSGKIEDERIERISADTELWEAVDSLSGAIDTEREEREAADEVLSGAIDTLRIELDIEREEREAADEVLSGAIDTLREDLDEEIDRAKAAEEEISGLTIDTSIDYVIEVSATDGDYNMILKSKDGIDDHFVKIKFDGDFGSI